MRESSYYAKVREYYTKNASTSHAIEVKFTRTNTVPFSAIPGHQEHYLSQKTWCYKIADTGMGTKPVDIVCLKGQEGLLVLVYYKPRQTRIFEVPIRTFLTEKYTGGKKSIHIDRAAELGKEIQI